MIVPFDSIGSQAAFQLITLPVEFNASSRAMNILADGDYITVNEEKPVKREVFGILFQTPLFHVIID
jgi:Zn-dependent membrane protease YugP